MAPDDEALAINQHVIDAFRAGAHIEGMHRDRLLLLTTRGRRTGRVRTTPMMHVVVGPSDHADRAGSPVRPRRVVIASGNGSPQAPAWFANLAADPAVHVEVDGDAYDATARVAAGSEREQIWAGLTADYPFFEEHAERAGRELPLVVLEPAD